MAAQTFGSYYEVHQVQYCNVQSGSFSAPLWSMHNNHTTETVLFSAYRQRLLCEPASPWLKSIQPFTPCNDRSTE